MLYGEIGLRQGEKVRKYMYSLNYRICIVHVVIHNSYKNTNFSSEESDIPYNKVSLSDHTMIIHSSKCLNICMRSTLNIFNCLEYLVLHKNKTAYTITVKLRIV